MNHSENCLSRWFPPLLLAGLPVPRTEIVHTPADLDLVKLIDGDDMDLPLWRDFLAEMQLAGRSIGYPLFLRTGQGSGKHEWDLTCFVASEADLVSHVAALVEWSHMVDIMGLPTDVWALREMLPTISQFIAYHGMPVCREFRFFVREGKAICAHPYWPRASLIEGFSAKPSKVNDWVSPIERELPDRFDDRYDALCYLPAVDEPVLRELAERAGQAQGGGSWSVDLLETRRGWFVTDMDQAAESFHWPNCEHASSFLR